MLLGREAPRAGEGQLVERRRHVRLLRRLDQRLRERERKPLLRSCELGLPLRQLELAAGELAREGLEPLPLALISSSRGSIATAVSARATGSRECSMCALRPVPNSAISHEDRRAAAEACPSTLSGCEAVPRRHLRLPDERPRLRADQGPARGARARRGDLRGGRRRARLQHLHDPREARPAARRAPRAGEGAEGREPGARDRRRRLLRRGAARADLRALPVRRRRVRTRLDRAPRRLARRGRRRRRAAASASTTAPSPATLPMHRERPFQAWVQVSMGCNSKCAYCIVPSVRGRETSRRPGRDRRRGDAARRARASARSRCSARTSTPGAATCCPDARTEFGELLRACDAVDGIERIRFTSPHPKDFRRPVIEAMAECAAVCEHVHLPLQSGSARILKAMRRTYTPRALPARSSPSCATRSPTSRSAPTSSSASPARRSDDFRGDARRRRAGRLRQRLHVRLLAARRHRGRRRCRTRCRTRSRSSGWSGSSRPCSAIAHERNQRASASSRRCSSRGRAAPTRRVLRGRTRRNTTVNFAGDAEPGELVAGAHRERDLDDAARARRQRWWPREGPDHRLERPDRHQPRRSGCSADGH